METLPVLAGRHRRRPRLRRAPDRAAVPRGRRACWRWPAPGCSTRWRSATTWPAASAAASARDRLVLGLAVRAARRRRHRAGRADRVRRPDRAARRARRGRRRLRHRCCRFSLGSAPCWSSLADTVGRVVLPPTEVQVGIMTAVVGVPVFLCLVRRGRIGGAVMTHARAAAGVRRPTSVAGASGRAAPPGAPAPRWSSAGLSLVLLGVFAARVLLGDFTFTIPDFFRILFGDGDPGRDLHPDGEQAAAGGARRAGRASRSASAARSSRPRCATRWPAPTSSASASAPAPPPWSRSSRSACAGPGVSRSPRSSAPSASPPLVRLVAGPARRLPARAGRRRRRRRAAVGDPVRLHPRRRVRRPAGAALADRQRQRRRLADASGCWRWSCWCCCR